MAGETVVGELVTKLTADAGDFSKGMSQARDEMDKTGDAAGKMDTVLKGAVIGFAAIGTAAAAGAVKLFELGSSFDDAYDRIRTGTGATGDALEALKADFDAVAAAVPASFETVGTAITELHQRTGLVGEDLQGLSTTMIQFSKVTGTDLSTNIQLATRMFGDWGIATENQAATMDKVLRASQASGVEVGRLQQLLVQFGAPLRQFGFSWEESAAMLSKWEKEGVNVELVMGSLRIAMGHFAREGIDLKTGLQDTIEKIKNMEDASAATAEAMRIFGARAGPDMAAAIREGRFEFADYVDLIENGSDTVAQSAEDTKDAAEKWAEFGNRVAVALKPLAEGVFAFASAAADVLLPAIEGLIKVAAPLAQAFGENLARGFKTLADNLAPVGERFKEVQKATSELVETHDMDTLSAGLQSIAGILRRDFGPETATLFERTTSAVGEFFKKLGDGLKDTEDSEAQMDGFAGAVERMAGSINTALDKIKPFTDWLGTEFKKALEDTDGPMQRFKSNMEELGASGEQLNPLDQALKAISLTILQTFGPDAQGAFDTFTSALGRANEFAAEKLDEIGSKFMELGPLIGPALESLGSMVQGALAGIAGFFTSHSAELQAIVGSLWEIIKSIVETGINLAFAPAKVALQVLQGDFSGAWETINSTVMSAVGALGNIVGNGLNLVVQVIKGAIGEWVGQFNAVGGQIAAGVAAGIAGGLGQVAEAARNLVGGALEAAKAKAGIQSPSTLFRDQVGVLIGEGIAVGIDMSSDLAVNAIGKMTESLLKEAWRLSKTDAFAQLGHDFIKQTVEGIEKGTPSAIAAAEKSGTAIIAKLKTSLPPEEAEMWAGQFIAAWGEAIRGNPEGLIALGEVLDGMRTRISEFAHERHGEVIAQGIADSIAAPSSKETIRRAAFDAVSVMKEAIENETDQTVAAATRGFAKLADALKKALPPELAEEAIRALGVRWDAAWDAESTEMLDGIDLWAVDLADSMKQAQRSAESIDVGMAVANSFFGKATKDKLELAGDEFMDTVIKSVETGGKKAITAAQKSAEKLAKEWEGKLDPDEFAKAVAKIQDAIERAWDTGDLGILREVDDTVNDVEEKIRKADWDKAMADASRKVADAAFPPSAREKLRRQAEDMFEVVDDAIGDMTPKAIKEIGEFGSKVADEIRKSLPPEKAKAALATWNQAVQDVLAGGGEDAARRLREAWVEVDRDIAQFGTKGAQTAKTASQQIAEGLAGEELRKKIGDNASKLLEAFAEGMDNPADKEKAKQKIAGLALDLLDEWKHKLPPDAFAARMRELLRLIDAVFDPNNPDAAGAIASLRQFVISMNAEGAKIGEGFGTALDGSIQTAKTKLGQWEQEYQNRLAQLANTPIPTPPSQDPVQNLPPNQPPSPPPGQPQPPAQPGVPNPPNQPNPYHHQHPLWTVQNGQLGVPLGGMSPTHAHGESGAHAHSHVANGYGPSAGVSYAEGGVVTEPTLALLGDAGEPEFVIPQSKLFDPEFLASIGIFSNAQPDFSGPPEFFTKALSGYFAKATDPVDPDAWNDWLTHLPQQMRPAVLELGQLGVSFDQVAAYLEETIATGDATNAMLHEMPEEAWAAARAVGGIFVDAMDAAAIAAQLYQKQLEAVNAQTQGMPPNITGMVDALVTAGAPLDALTRYLAFVNEEGDYMNDWVTHLPENMRGFVVELGKLMAQFHTQQGETGFWDPAAPWAQHNPHQVINPITGEVIREPSFPAAGTSTAGPPTTPEEWIRRRNLGDQSTDMDINGDGSVDLADYALLLQRRGGGPPDIALPPKPPPDITLPPDMPLPAPEPPTDVQPIPSYFQGGPYPSVMSAWRASGLSQEDFAKWRALHPFDSNIGYSTDQILSMAEGGGLLGPLGSSVLALLHPPEAVVPLDRLGGLGGSPDALAAALARELQAHPIRAFVTQGDMAGTRLDLERRGFVLTGS